MEDDKINQNGRWPKNSKWKTTKKFKMEDDQKKSKMEDDKNFKMHQQQLLTTA